MGKRFIILLSVILALGICGNLFGAEAQNIFDEANKLYEDEKYSEALEKYMSLVDEDYESAALYFNIGNCYIKENKFGYGILYYLKAEKLDPSDEEIQANLDFARQFMPTQLEGVRINPVATFFETLVGPFTLKTLAWLSSALFIIVLLLISYVIFFQHNNLFARVGIYVLLILFVSSAFLTTYKYRTDALTQSGVIVSDEAVVYSSPTENGEIEFVGAFGLMVEVDKKKDDFYLVKFENQRKGWIKADDLGII